MDASLYQDMARLAGDHWWFSGRREILRAVLRHFLPPGRVSLLDVGAGTGGNLDMLSEFGEVWALEPEATAREHCRARGSAVAVLDSVVPGPSLGRQFDVICLFDVVEHVEDHRATIDWVDRHLRDGGLAVITVPAFGFLWSDHDVAHHHYRRYTATELDSICRPWRLRHLTYFNTLLFPPIALIRTLRRLKGPPVADRQALGDARPVPSWANAFLRFLFAAERHWVTRWSVPFGVSLLGVYEREPR